MTTTPLTEAAVYQNFRLPKLPKKILEVVLFLEKFPEGLASTQISQALRGIAASSAWSQEITHARLAATRKQLQRARKYLSRTQAQLELRYCAKNRVWRAIRTQHESLIN